MRGKGDMSEFFISPSKPPELNESINYRIDPSEYALQMRQQWPDAKIVDLTTGGYVLHWELNRKGRLGLSGGLQSNGLVVNFASGPQADVIEFVLWHRAFVPSRISLYLFDANLDLVIELKPGIRKEDLTSSI